MSSQNDLSLENIKGEDFYKIPNSQLMRPFFMSLVSGSDHWMFVSSNGGMTMGRKNAEYALLPYYTDDMLVDLASTTGPNTIIKVKKGEKSQIWEPFRSHTLVQYNSTRNLYKNTIGNKLVFEEINYDLGLTFKTEWNTSDRFGFVRKSTLTNHSNLELEVEVLDGVQNLMPYGVGSDLQKAASNLVDAYKRTELWWKAKVAIYSLSAIIVDRAEPSEALKANVVWSFGLDQAEVWLSNNQVNAFIQGAKTATELDIKGEKGAYYLKTNLKLTSGKQKNWAIVMDTNYDSTKIVALSKEVLTVKDIEAVLQDDIDQTSYTLKSLVGQADGAQFSDDKRKDTRHFANTMFNIMRGGIFDHDYWLEKEDFLRYLKNVNPVVLDKNIGLLEGLGTKFHLNVLMDLVPKNEDADLFRIAKEYLPLKFSRRHGDPSRPWNRFSINLKDDEGRKILGYEGNWRDIFQNWEALALSYPLFINSMIFRFLNATTFDGYNPYRLVKHGFDWESIEPHDPWSYIGYWGDHQIIYLLKLLELSEQHDPDALKSLFERNCFVYANVPYKIKPYADIVKNPKDTILFDEALDIKLRKNSQANGADELLLKDIEGKTHQVGLVEKLFAPILAKICNLIPGAGIWMNTQRPEWNDANNALVGNGVSMVTLYYLRRHLHFLEKLFKRLDGNKYSISSEFLFFFKEASSILANTIGELGTLLNDEQQKLFIDKMGEAASNYRQVIYERGFDGKFEQVEASEILQFISHALPILDQTILANRRKDGLYHAYNLVSFDKGALSVSHLGPMLEGQVAVLSSGLIQPGEAVTILEAMRNSDLYRADQQSYMLYPNKNLPGFLSKNKIPAEKVANSNLIAKLIAEKPGLIVKVDSLGDYHFNGNFRNIGDLLETAGKMAKDGYVLSVDEINELCDLFEDTFNHKEFTGRSGTFFAYEGLGSIYWHMVSKLHLAVQEINIKATEEGVDKSLADKLYHFYTEIGKGIGTHKTPEAYGAFPTDPYSHTPFHKGVQQPGMTGQVKEDIIVRRNELGMRVANGILSFEPSLLPMDDFKKEASIFHFTTLDGNEEPIELAQNTLLFSCCQVPIIYQIADQKQTAVIYKDGQNETDEGLTLSEKQSRMLFSRSGEISVIKVFIPQNLLKR